MADVISANLDARGQRLAIVAARFNEFITTRLIDGALDAIVRHGGSADQVVRVMVPGSFELPLAALQLARSGKFSAIIAVGCLLRGQTPHFDLIAAEVTRGLGACSRETGVPVGFGVVTADTLEQAIERCGGKHGNKGADAALAAIEMANLLASISRQH